MYRCGCVVQHDRGLIFNVFPPIYSLPAAAYAKGTPSSYGGSTLMPGSAGYADLFKRDRAPTQFELLSHLVGTAYRCANLNANLLASTRLRLYLRTRKDEPKAKFVLGRLAMGRSVTIRIPRKRIKRWQETCGAGKSALLDAADSSDGDIEEVTDHPLLDLLRQPEDSTNDGGLSAYDHRWLIQCLLESVGVAYLYIAERNEFGQPKRLQLLRSQLVRPIPDPTGKRYILRYDYGTAKIDPKDIIRFALPDPANPHYNVLSPMRAAIEKIRLVRGGDAFTTALLENGGYPAGVWSPSGENGGIGKDIARRMTSEFRRAFSMSNVGRIFVTEEPGSLTPLSFKPAEIIDIERAKELVGEIADCFDIPRTKIFRNTSNRASGDSGDVDHQRDAGVSRCTRFEEVLNGQLVPLFDDSGRLFLAFDSPVQDDRTMILEEAKAGSQMALDSIDEGRMALGQDPLDNDLGRSRLVPATMVLLSEDGVATPLAPKPEPQPTAAGKPVDQPQPRKPKKSQLAKAVFAMAREVKALAEVKTIPQFSHAAFAPVHAETAPVIEEKTPDQREAVKLMLIGAGYHDDEADAAMVAKGMELAGSL